MDGSDEARIRVNPNENLWILSSSADNSVQEWVVSTELSSITRGYVAKFQPFKIKFSGLMAQTGVCDISIIRCIHVDDFVNDEVMMC